MKSRTTIPAVLVLSICVLGLAWPSQSGDSRDKSEILAVLTGDHADPSILRVGDDFYMTHSSYRYLPGLLVWHSKDLRRWERVGYALHRNVGDVWAPDLAGHGNKFYIYFPAGGTNWVVTADSLRGPWSDPVDLRVKGIDPGHVVAPDGKRYLYLDSGRVVELAPDGLSVRGETKHVYEGWTYPKDWVVEGFYIESPKLAFRNGFYYLTTAQGGTAGPSTGHMAVSAKSKSPLGPWENSPYNPVVHTWSRSDRWWSKGHGTIFSDAAGRWHIVYHAYENGYYPLGRNTLIEPIEGTADGWFKTVRDARREGPSRRLRSVVIEPDDFSGKELKLQWQFSGLDSLDDQRIKDGRLEIKSTPDKLRVLHATVGDHSYEASARLETEGDLEAGLIAYFDDRAFAGIGIKGGEVFGMAKGAISGERIKAPAVKSSTPRPEGRGLFMINPEPRFSSPPLKAGLGVGERVKYLRIRMNEFDLSMASSDDGRRWTPYPYSLEVSGYHQNVLGGFSHLKLGIFGRGAGVLKIDDFAYRNLE